MSDGVRSILTALEEFEETEAAAALELRLSLTELILRNMRRRQWSQRELARRAGVKEPFISRILHSNANCTLDTAAKLLFAFGVNVRFEQVVSVASRSGETGQPLEIVGQESTHGERPSTRQDSTGRGESTGRTVGPTPRETASHGLVEYTR